MSETANGLVVTMAGKSVMAQLIAEGKADPFSEEELILQARVIASCRAIVAPLWEQRAREAAKRARKAERVARRLAKKQRRSGSGAAP